MSTVIETPSPSRLPSHRPTPYANTQPKMYDLPSDFTAAQLEAKEILAHLLQRLQEEGSKHYPKYGKWVERHARLEEFCFRCIRPQIWIFLNGRWSLDAIKAVGGDLKYEGRGLYLDGVLGLDRKVRIYIGQAGSIRSRVGQHLNFRYRRDNPSLHYHAMQNSIYNSIGIIAQIPSPNMGNHTLPGMDCPDLLLNVLEMWMCLVFRTLPLQTLDLWLPNDKSVKRGRKSGQEGDFGGLNVASPLDQGEKQREWLDLGECEDAFICEYIAQSRVGTKLDTKEDDSPTQRRINYTERAKSLNKHWKQPDPVNTGSKVAEKLFLISIAALIGTALFRAGAASAAKAPGRWR